MKLRTATFNLENLDDHPGKEPALADRIALLRPQLVRLRADILCLQEVNAQQRGPDRTLLALDQLLSGTDYADFHRAVTTNQQGDRPRDIANLVILSRFPIRAFHQIHHDYVAGPRYQPLTAEPPAEVEEVRWDRPILWATIDGLGQPLHVVNLHLKAPLAAFVPGQKKSAFVWKSVPGWAEGYFLGAVKRTGQALEARLIVDRLFDEDAEASILVCGDFNAESRESPMVIIRGDTEEVGNGRLAYRALVTVERTLPESERYTVRHWGEKVMLDHMLISRPLLGALRGAEIHNEMLPDELAAFYSQRNDPESFHAPMVAEFELPDI